MATIDNKGRIRGTAGSVVYRTYREMNIVQGKPRKIKQSKGSVRTSAEFGLSSSSAAVIRRAFEPAYIYRDGKAASRTTQQLYRSLRNSLTGSIGQRDLHDADLQDLLGMDFNGSSKLSEVLQVNHSVRRNADGNLEISLGRFNPRADVKKAAGYPKAASRYRLRLMAVAFDFRQEYLEYLDIKDIDIKRTEIMQEQTITLKAQADPGCMVLISMSLLMYDQVGHTGEYVLLNNKGFSPCGIIAAYQAEQPASLTTTPISISQEKYPERCMKMQEMDYEGNRLLKELQKRTPAVKRQQPCIDPGVVSHNKTKRAKAELSVRLGVKTSFGKI